MTTATATKTKNTENTDTGDQPSDGRLSRTELQEAKKDLVRALVRGEDHHLQAYLDELATTARNARVAHGMFKRWSMSNRLSLESQRRRLGESHRGLYAGVAQWAKLERQVRDDARPKIIWAYAGRDDEDDTDRPVRVRFVPVKVFDWTDTEYLDRDRAEPDWATPLAAGDRATFDALVASSPVEVAILDQPARSEHGKLTAQGITLYDASRPIGNRIETLAHELAHYHLDHLGQLAAAGRSSEDMVRGRIEQEAQLGAWLVMKILGLDEQAGNDVTTHTAAYLRSWDVDGEHIGGNKRRMKLLNERLEVALTAAETIVDAALAQAA